MILGLIIGNTSVRYGRLDLDSASRIAAAGRVLVGDGARPLDRAEIVSQPGGRRLEAILREQEIDSVVAASVRDDRLDRFLAALPALPAPLRAGADLPLGIANEAARPEEVGVDRLLNSLAVRARAPGRGAIAVDFGSAIALSVVSPAGAFVGGAIAAGGEALRAGLRVRTPRLEVPELVRPSRAIGKTTRGALEVGLFWQLAGGAERLIEAVAADCDFAIERVVATGGDAALAAPAIESIDEVVEDLTLEGLRLAYAAHVAARQSPP